MKQITISKLKTMPVEDIKNSGSFQLMADGEEIAIVVVGAQQLARDKVITVAGQVDVVRGKCR